MEFKKVQFIGVNLEELKKVETKTLPQDRKKPKKSLGIRNQDQGSRTSLICSTK